jgi:D-glycero-beta-D-manno-heptose-7-phosphate kinase
LIATDILQQFVQKKVLIVGDVMIDRYVYGHVSRISPEAPVPVLEWKKTENRLGGAANVALNIKALGATPLLVGVGGDDEDGLLLRALLESEQIENQHIILIGNRPTTVKTRFIAADQQLLRLDQETIEDVDNHSLDILFVKIKTMIQTQSIDVIIFQDYNKGLLAEIFIKKIIKLAISHKIPTTVDPKKKNFTAFQNVTLFKPNLKEISAFLGKNIEGTLVDLQAASAAFRTKCSCQNIMITLSALGIFVENEQKEAFVLPTTPRKIADVCGAGDTVISVASLGIACGLDMKQIAILCNIAGGQVCEEVGVVPIRRDRFLAEILSSS